MSLASSSLSRKCELNPWTPFPLSRQAEKSGFRCCVNWKWGGFLSCSPSVTEGTVSAAGSYIVSHGSGTRYFGVRIEETCPQEEVFIVLLIPFHEGIGPFSDPCIVMVFFWDGPLPKLTTSVPRWRCKIVAPIRQTVLSSIQMA